MLTLNLVPDRWYGVENWIQNKYFSAGLAQKVALPMNCFGIWYFFLLKVHYLELAL